MRWIITRAVAGESALSLDLLVIVVADIELPGLKIVTNTILYAVWHSG